MAEVITECECGQLEPLQLGCEACGAEIGEECRPMCIGQALANDEAHVFSAEQDAVYAHLSRAHCSCGWQSGGYSKIPDLFWQQHVTAADA